MAPHVKVNLTFDIFPSIFSYVYFKVQAGREGGQISGSPPSVDAHEAAACNKKCPKGDS
jgi:hypothetical protein